MIGIPEIVRLEIKRFIQVAVKDVIDSQRRQFVNVGPPYSLT
jgi:hypothetical protein